MSVNGKWAAESYSENTSKSPFDFHVNRRQEPRAKAEGTKAQPRMVRRFVPSAVLGIGPQRFQTSHVG